MEIILMFSEESIQVKCNHMRSRKLLKLESWDLECRFFFLRLPNS